MPRAGDGRHAIVIGASMAGLAIAKALTAGFERVTVIERDHVPDTIAQRPGVPQGRHVHLLLAAGANALEALFPGLVDEMVADGAPKGDMAAHGRIFVSGHRLARTSTGHEAVYASRPFIEGHVRQRVRADPAVTIMPRCEVRDLVVTRDGRRVVGVEVDRRDGDETRTLSADLVVDCSGRRSALPQRLEQLGFDRPARDELRVDLHYATRHYRLPDGLLDQEFGVLVGPLPHRARAAGMQRIEGDRWQVTLAGWKDEKPPLEPDAYEAFAATLAVDDLYEVLRQAQPLDDPVRFRYPASVRHRYDRLRRFPEGLLAAGDAVCSFNPIYGQGMTVAALEGATLRRLLGNGGIPTAQTWFRSAASVVGVPWTLALTSDLGLHSVEGPRTLGVRALNGYIARLHAAAAHDPQLGRRFLRVTSLIDPPTRLARPSVLARVLRGNLPRRRGVAGTPTSAVRN